MGWTLDISGTNQDIESMGFETCGLHRGLHVLLPLSHPSRRFPKTEVQAVQHQNNPTVDYNCVSIFFSADKFGPFGVRIAQVTRRDAIHLCMP
jgi:hypothetical protein